MEAGSGLPTITKKTDAKFPSKAETCKFRSDLSFEWNSKDWKDKKKKTKTPTEALSVFFAVSWSKVLCHHTPTLRNAALDFFWGWNLYTIASIFPFVTQITRASTRVHVCTCLSSRHIALTLAHIQCADAPDSAPTITSSMSCQQYPLCL